MALTAAQRLLVCEICEISPANPIRRQDGTLSGAPITLDPTYSAIAQLDARLDSLTAAEELSLTALLDEWDKVRLSATDIVDGGMEGLAGVRDRPDVRRGLIARTVRNLLGVFQDGGERPLGARRIR